MTLDIYLMTHPINADDGTGIHVLCHYWSKMGIPMSQEGLLLTAILSFDVLKEDPTGSGVTRATILYDDVVGIHFLAPHRSKKGIPILD